jgi:branched-chain amino acid transport system ATP-binding protein
MLEVNEINTYYGDAHVLHDLSLEVEEGEIVSLIGRNGAGKTTTLRSIMGLTPPRSGSVVFRGEDITGDTPESVYKRGIGFIPETRNIFPELTVLENLKVGMPRNAGPEALEQVYQYFPRLEERSQQIGQTLSGGEQQMLAIGRVLVSSPDLLLLDEPTEGLMPSLVDTIATIVRQLNEAGHTIVLVEQHSKMALELSDRAYLISKGEVQHEGDSDEMAANLDEFTEHLAV